MKSKILAKIVFLVFAVMIFTSCKKELLTSVPDESVKDITGKWRMVALTRNGEDMTARMDLSKFRIVFNADGTYTLENRFAFLVDGPGTYSLSDPQFPFSLSMTQQSQPGAKAKFQFPVIAGKRQLSLTMSMGCASNSYQFNFEKEN